MTTLSSDTRLQRHPGLIATDMDGDIVMMSIDQGEYFGIGGVGPRVWHLLENPVAVAEVVASIRAEFDVDAATCEADMRVFLQQLLDHGVITLV